MELLVSKEKSDNDIVRTRLLSLLTCLSTCLLTVGCSGPDPNPELLDPIYRGIKGELAFITKDVDDAQKKLEDAEKALDKGVPQTADYKLNRIDFFKAKAAWATAKQNVLIKELELSVRLKNDRHNYFEAYKKHKEWPDPTEFALYKKKKERSDSPRSWDQVLKSRLPAAAVDSKDKSAKEEKKKPGSEGE